MENEYDEIDYDGIESSDSPDNHQNTASEVDQVAALLLDAEGDEESAGQVRDTAKTKIYDSDGTAKNNTKTWTSTPIDRHGNREFGGDDSSLRESKKEPEYGLQGYDIHQQTEAAQAQWDQAQDMNQKLETMYRNGEITFEDYNQGTYMAGQMAGQARQQAYESKIAGYEYEKQAGRAYEQLAAEFPEFGPETRKEALMETAEWMMKQGLDASLLQQVDDPNIIAVARRTMKALENERTNRLENAALKQKVRDLNKALGRGKKKAAKSRNMGNRHGGPVGESQLEEIADLIFGGGK